MDSNVHDDSVPMEEAATEESTSSASRRSKSCANPEATNPSTPVEKQASDETGFVLPKRKKRKDKLPAEKSADAALPKLLPKDVTKPSQSSQTPLSNIPLGAIQTVFISGMPEVNATTNELLKSSSPRLL